MGTSNFPKLDTAVAVGLIDANATHAQAMDFAGTETDFGGSLALRTCLLQIH
jgi:hypothetical protein